MNARRYDLPISCCFVVPPSELAALRQMTSYPVFETPEQAVEALHLLRQFHNRPTSRFQAQPELGECLLPKLAGPVGSGTSWLDGETCFALLERLGIPVPRWGVAKTAEEAAQTADVLNPPLVLKVLSPQILHKTDAGAIALNVNDADGARARFRSLWEKVSKANPSADIDGVLIQEQANSGVEVLVGGRRDPNFGPVIVFGLGGIFAEALNDVAIRVAPIDKAQVNEMIREIRGSQILLGYRGRERADLEALTRIILGTSQLLLDCPQIEEIDLNPVRVFSEGKGAMALDVRIRVTQ